MNKSKPLRWGILGTANIARKALLPAFQTLDGHEVLGIASRDGSKAKEFAKDLNIPRSYGSYEELLADPDIDAIYNPLPNHLHVPLSLKALEAGKHVLCEKPLAMNAQEARQLLAASKKHTPLQVMEAFMYRFHPQWRTVRKWIDDGCIGELRHIESSFHFTLQDKENVRYRPEYGGGGLLDVGCYCASLSRMLFQKEPLRVSGSVYLDPDFQVDRQATALMDFGTGTASFICGIQLHGRQQAKLIGTKGEIEISTPFLPPKGKPTQLTLTQNDKTQRVEIEEENQYGLMIEAFTQTINDKTSPQITLENSVNTLKVLDAVNESSKSDRWIRIN